MENQNNVQFSHLNTELKSFSQLLKESWDFYKTKIRTLLVIVALPVIFSLFFLVLIYFLGNTNLKYSILFSLIEAFSLLGSFVLWLWIIPALILSIKNNTGAVDSLKDGLKLIIPYFWIYFLLYIIISGGFLLLVIPGILFSIWFSFAIYVFIFEKKKGFNALFASKELVSGNFVKVLWRFLAFILMIGLFLFIVFIPLTTIFQNTEFVSEITGYLIQLFIIPLFFIFGFFLYKNLREVKKDIIYPEPSTGRKIKYMIPGFFGILIVVFIVTFLSLNIFWGRDEPPFDDSSLWLSKVEINESDNAFYYFSDIREKIYIPYNKEENQLFRDMSEGKAWDNEFAKELIDKNNEAFEYLDKGLNCSVYQNPNFTDPSKVYIGTVLISLSHLKSMAKLSSIKSFYLLKQNKPKESLDQSIKILELSHMLKNAPLPNTIDNLVGLAIDEIGFKNLRLIISDDNLSSLISKEYIIKLNEFRESNNWIKDCFKLEYSNQQNTLEQEIFSRNDLPYLIDSYFYKPNKTKRIFAEHYQRMIGNAEKDYYNDIEIFEYQRLCPDSWIKIIFTENLVGKIFYDMTVVSQEGLIVKRCLDDFSLNGTQVLMALRSYQIDNGKLPNSLDELVPEYISEVPKDPFDGEPIRFSSEKKIIYSVGEDFLDSGGSEGESLSSMPDPTFKINF